MLFPIYRKYKHNRTFFKINSPEDFEELNILGSSYQYKHFKVRIFTDRLFIQDMIDNTKHHWVEITSNEYEGKKTFCMENLTLVKL